MAVDRNVLLLYKSIAHFLRAEIESKKYSSEINESLEGKVIPMIPPDGF